MDLAPIVLFVFNRPFHTKKTIESLRMNALSAESELFIYSDGPKNKKDEAEVNKVREYLNSINGFKKINIVQGNTNMGLAKSVIAGVTEIIQQFEKAIVIEDDLLFSPYFLNYMNSALRIYSSDSRIFSIGGYSPSLDIPQKYKEDSYLSFRCCTWGWATWKDRWESVDWEVKDYDEFIHNEKKVRNFNKGGSDMSYLLTLQMSGKIDSWGIRWDYAHYKNSAFCFRPVNSIVENIGNDGTGVHCGVSSKFDVTMNTKSTFSFPEPYSLMPDKEINEKFAEFYGAKRKNKILELLKFKNKKLLFKKIKNFFVSR